MNKILLDKAYKSGKNQIYDKASDTLVVSGTHNIQDILTDIKDVPTNNIVNTDRYKQAKQVYTKYHPSHLLGHSLGGLIVNELVNREHFKGKATIYNAPLVSGISTIKPNVEDHSKWGDIISMLDITAKRTKGSLNPLSAHSYK